MSQSAIGLLASDYQSPGFITLSESKLQWYPLQYPMLAWPILNIAISASDPQPPTFISKVDILRNDNDNDPLPMRSLVRLHSFIEY